MNKRVKYTINDSKIIARVVDLDKQSGNLILKLKNGDHVRVSSPNKITQVSFLPDPVFNIDFTKAKSFFNLKDTAVLKQIMHKLTKKQ